MLKPAFPSSILLTFVGFFAVGLLLVVSSINSPFLWDDLHLIRVHTPAELASVWAGTWDTNHIETPGFRPLTTYFNHFRALAFGESLTAHRLFLVLLFAVFLTMAGIIARWLLAAPFWQIVLGGLLGLMHLDSVYHYFWISDGVHLLAGILILGAILSMLRALSSGLTRWLVLSLLCSVLALLTREDSLTVYPLLLWFGIGFVQMNRGHNRPLVLRPLALAVFAGFMLSALAMYWYWRGAAVPKAVPLKVDPAALVWGAAQTVQDAGDHQLLAVAWPRYDLIISLWQAWLGLLVVIGLFFLKRRAQLIVLFLGGASLIAAAPVLAVARTNLLLLPVAFWGLLVSHVLTQFWRRCRAIGPRVFASGMILFALAAPAYGSLLLQQEMRPNNLNWMCRNATLLYGVSGPATIPAARRETVQRQLNFYGISDLAAFEALWPSMERKALADGRFGVNAQGLPFIPRFEFMPQFLVHPRCEPPR